MNRRILIPDIRPVKALFESDVAEQLFIKINLLRQITFDLTFDFRVLRQQPKNSPQFLEVTERIRNDLIFSSTMTLVLEENVQNADGQFKK